MSNVSSRSAWRVEGALREFPTFPPLNLWFDYPTHRVDDSGSLKDVEPDGEAPPWKKNFPKKDPVDKQKERLAALETAVKSANFGEQVTVLDLAEFMGATEKTIRNRIKEHPKYEIVNNEVREIVENPRLLLFPSRKHSENYPIISLHYTVFKMIVIVCFSINFKQCEICLGQCKETLPPKGGIYHIFPDGHGGK